MAEKRKNDAFYDDGEYGNDAYPPRGLLAGMVYGIGAALDFGWRAVLALLGQVWRFTRGCLRLAWQLTAWAWGQSWRLAGMGFVAAWAVTRLAFNWSLAAAVFTLSFFVRWVFGYEMRRDLPEYDEYGNPIVAAIRQRVGRRYRRRGRLVIMGVFALLVCMGVWVDALRVYDPVRHALPLTIFMAIIMGIHVVNFFVAEAEDSAVEREMQASGQRQPIYEEFVERQMRLTDDGEVVPVDFEWWEKRKAGYQEQPR